MCVDENGCEKTNSQRISRANQWWGRMASAGRIRSNKYEVVVDEWKGTSVPVLLYGLGTRAWTGNERGK